MSSSCVSVFFLSQANIIAYLLISPLQLTTYWLDMTASTSPGSVVSSAESSGGSESGTDLEDVGHTTQNTVGSGHVSDKTQRLVDWNAYILSGLLRQIIASRQSAGVVPDSPDTLKALEEEVGENDEIMDEVQEILTLP